MQWAGMINAVGSVSLAGLDLAGRSWCVVMNSTRCLLLDFPLFPPVPDDESQDQSVHSAPELSPYVP